MVDIICFVLLVPMAVAGLSYSIPTLIAQLPRRRRADHPSFTFAILIPANDEEAVLPTAIASLLQLDYPTDMVRVYVVADNCSDATADVAAAAGAVCLVRNDPTRTGKGYALEFGIRAVLADDPDVVVILDADCQLNSEALRELGSLLKSCDVAQASVRSCNADDGPGSYVAAVGSIVDDAVATGLDRLGRSVALRGTGMAFRHAVFGRVPWIAFGAVEDAEYDVRLQSAGVRVRYCGGTMVRCCAPKSGKALYRQRRRWRGALFAAGSIGLPTRLLQSKPLVLFYSFATSVVCFAIGSEWTQWCAAVAFLPTAAVYARAVAVLGFTRHRMALLARAPGTIAQLGWLTLAGIVRRTPARWESRRVKWEAVNAVREKAELDKIDTSPPRHPVPSGRKRGRAADLR